MDESILDTDKKRWATSLKSGDLVTISGPSELFVRRIEKGEVDLLFVLDREVMCFKEGEK